MGGVFSRRRQRHRENNTLSLVEVPPRRPSSPMLPSPSSSFSKDVVLLSPKFAAKGGETVKEDDMWDLLEKEYCLGTTIADGRNCREIRSGYHRETKRLVAFKIADVGRFKGDRYQLKIDALMLRSFRHPHIARYYDFYESDKCVVLVMEYATCRDLREFVNIYGALTESIAHRLFRQLVSALIYLVEEKKVRHGDVKMDNILCTGESDGQLGIRLADFELSQFILPNVLETRASGTHDYAAPEIFSHGRVIPYDPEKADVYSAGVCFYAMLTGRLPFPPIRESSTLAAVRCGLFRTPLTVSEPARLLIRAMMSLEPEKRPTFREVMNYEWMVTGGISQAHGEKRPAEGEAEGEEDSVSKKAATTA